MAGLIAAGRICNQPAANAVPYLPAARMLLRQIQYGSINICFGGLCTYPPGLSPNPDESLLDQFLGLGGIPRPAKGDVVERLFQVPV